MSPVTLVRKVLTAFLLCSVVTMPLWAAERVKTDGKNKDSPIRVLKMDFQDSGYGLPGPTAEIRISTTVQNSSTTDDLKNVVIHLQLKNLDGDVVQEWTKNLPVMKKNTTVEFSPDAIYYNYTFNNLQGGVMVEHDKVQPAEDAGDKATDKTTDK
jgi:hypothetical protein